MLANQIGARLSAEQSAPARSKFPRWIWLASIVLIAAVVVVLASGPAATVNGSIGNIDPAQAAAIQEAWGIRFTSVAVTAAGGFVDVRFQVIDPDKALGTHDPEGLPKLIDASTGMVFDKGGSHAAHQDTMRAGGTYYLLYQNTGGRLKSGSQVSIQIGEARLDNVVVQ